jgi:hypothetical protein
MNPRYKQILEARKSQAPTYKVKSPSGMEWEMRRVNAQSYILAGKLPLAVAQKVAATLEDGESSEAAFAELTSSEQADAVKFMQTLVKESVVHPKIVQEATTDDEIDEILEEDFAFLLREAMGGERAESLANFRGGQVAVPVSGHNGKKRRKAA